MIPARYLFCLIHALLVIPPTVLFAAPVLEMPFAGVAQGHDVAVPITIRVDDNLANLDCSIRFDGTLLSCSDIATLLSGPPDIVLAVSAVQAGVIQLQVHSSSGDPFTEDVVCELTFSALTNAPSRQVQITSGPASFEDDTGTAITGTVNPGLILVGSAFGFTPEGGRAQFCGVTGSNYIIQATEDLLSWSALATNTAAEGLVWVVDADSLPQRFYRAVPEYASLNQCFGTWIQVTSPTTNTLAGVAFGNGIVVAVGDRGTAIRSLNGGSNWVDGNVGTLEPLYDVAWGNGCFVACGSDGGIYRSTNGSDWATVKTSDCPLFDVAFAHGTFVCVGSNSILTSSNGLDWTDILSDWDFYCVTADSVGWTVGGIDPAALLFLPGSGLAFGSGSNLTITTATILGPPMWVPVAIAYGNGTYVGAEGAEPGILLSEGSPLPFPDNNPTGNYWGVVFGFRTFVAVGESGMIINSPNGQNWAVNDTPTVEHLRDVGATDRRFISVGDGGTILLSPEQN